MTTGTKTTKKINAATIWIVTDAAIEAGVDVAAQRERLLDIFERGIPRPPTCYWDGMASTPVDINIRLADVDRAVDQWAETCGDRDRVIAIRHHKPSYDRYNEPYAG
jgi:hypothetical protein